MLIDKSYNVSEITTQMVRDWNEQILKNGKNEAATLEVFTKRGKSKVLDGRLSSDNKVVWRCYDWERGYIPLTNELAKLFDPEAYARHEARKQADKKVADAAAKAAVKKGLVKIGSIFCMSYGYDATLYEFFEVVSITASGKSCYVRRLKEESGRSTGPCSWMTRPLPGQYMGEQERHLINWSFGSPSIRIDNYYDAYLLDKVEWIECDDYH